MLDGAVILALIAAVSFVGMTCLIVDIFKKDDVVVIKPRSKTKPQPYVEENDVLIDENCFDN